MAAGFDEGVRHSRSGFPLAQRFDSWPMLCAADQLRACRAHKMQVSSTASSAAIAPRICDASTPKRPTNVSVGVSLLRAARELNLSLSQGAGGASARAGLANIQPIVRLVMM